MPKKNPSVKLPLSQKVLDALFERNLSYCQDLVDSVRTNALTAIATGLVAGSTVTDIIKTLKEQGFDANRAEVIARTEIMYALNESALAEYSSLGVERVEWLSTEDDRVCTEDSGPEIELPDGEIVYGCLAMNGRIFNIEEAPDNPAHPNCRCTYLPLPSEDKT